MGVVLELRNESFTYANVQEPTIRNLSLQTRSSTLTIVLGPVGSGKSTLLKAILKHTSRTFSPLHTSTIAYCAQDPWLPDLTVQNIVVGTLNLDPGWYSTVLDVCASRLILKPSLLNTEQSLGRTAFPSAVGCVNGGHWPVQFT